MNNLISITLTHEEWNTLRHYILRNSKNRKENIDKWEHLSHKMNDDGTPEFPNSQDMKQFLEEQNNIIDDIEKKISHACLTPQISKPRLEELVTLFKDGLIEDDEEQAYIYFKDICDINFFEADFLGLEFDKWEEYNGEIIFDEE